MNLWNTYIHDLITVENEPEFDPAHEEYLALNLPDVPPPYALESIDIHMMSVFVAMKNKDRDFLVLSSPLIMRRFSRHEERRSFTSMTVLMSQCSKILREGTTVTNYEVFEYFQNKYEETFFHNQEDCDKAIRETSMLLGISRRSMGILA